MTGLYLLNENKKAKIEDKAEVKNNINYNNLNMFNPLSAVKIYIKSCEFIIEKITASFKIDIGNKREIYEGLDKAVKIVNEFKKAFLLPKDHEAYTNFYYLYERFDVIDQMLGVYIVNNNIEYANDVIKITEKVKEIFEELLKVMDQIKSVQTVHDSVETLKENINQAIDFLPEKLIKDGLNLKFSV